MKWPRPPSNILTTILTLVIGASGAGLGWLLNAPIYMLLGPAVLVSLAGLAGARMGIALSLRNGCFVIIGLSVGAGFDHNAVDAMLR